MEISAYTVKAMKNGHSQPEHILVFKSNCRLMQIKSIAGAFYNTFNLH